MGILDGILGAITSPIATIASGLIGSFGQQQTNQTNLDIAQQSSAASAEQAELNRQFQQRSADTQMGFQQKNFDTTLQYGRENVGEQERYQTEMSNTAYQRAVRDMEAAGLNPMLAYSQGGASTPSVSSPTASTPGGASASGSQGQVFQPAAFTSPMTAGMQSAQAAANVEMQRAQTDNIKADTLIKGKEVTKRGWEARTAELESDIKVYDQHLASARDNYALERAKAERDNLVAQATKMQEEARLTGYAIPEAIATSDFWKSTFGKSKPYMDYGAGLAGKLGSAAMNFVPASKTFNIIKGLGK